MYDELAIKYNNAATNDPCAICGDRTDPGIGPELFIRDSMALVCYYCGEKLAPELMECLRLYRAVMVASSAEEDWAGYLGDLEAKRRQERRAGLGVDEGDDLPF